MGRLFIKFKHEAIIVILLSAISALHYISNSFDTPYHSIYRLLYLIPIILGAFRYGFRGGIIVSLLSSAIYSPHILLTAGLGVEEINEVMDIILFFAVGLLTGTLVERKDVEKRKQDELLRQHIILDRYSSSIIESIKSGVIVINNDMLITLVNNGAKKILEIEGDYTGNNFTDVFSCCETIRDNIMVAIKNNETTENIEMYQEWGGSPKIIRSSFYPLNFETLRKGFVVILDDITELKGLQNNVQRNEKLIALSELASGFAHEIRNPLAIIKAIEQTMRSELKDNKEAITELLIIDEEVDRANRVVKLLIDFAKPDKYERGILSINIIIRDVLIVAQKYINQHNVIINLEEDEVPYIEAVNELLKQAFINLIFNAVDAMPDGGILSIQVTKKEKDWIKIIFRDTGIGIDKSILDKIFNPFFTTKDKGTGLGLSIVNRIVDEHGGSINVSSEVGVGTKFELSIPVRGLEVKSHNEQNFNS